MKKQREARVVRDPRLLPYTLTKAEAAALVRKSPRTVDEWCRANIWKRGVHYTVPHGRRRLFLRDGVLAWLEERDRRDRPARPVRTGVNLKRSPELAAALERERHGVRG